MTIDELITVLQAAKEGKPCQNVDAPFNIEQWVNILRLRIKPEPRRVWVNYYPGKPIRARLFLTESAAKEMSADGVTVEFLEVTKP